MKLRVLTLAFDPELGRFDDEPACTFLADKELLELRDHFFVYQGQPHLAMVLTYRPGTPAPRPPADPKAKEARRDSWRELLEPGDMPLFNTLREWRGQRAKTDGIPSYVIANNRQLAKLARARPRTLGKLGEMEGFGAAKLKKYGQDILSLLAGGQETPARSQEAPARSDKQRQEDELES